MEQILTNYVVENELITVELVQIDVINNTRQFTQSLEEYLILSETPTKLTASVFQAANDYIEDSLVVYLNGIKLLSSDYTIIDSKNFKLGIDTIATDGVEVSYIKNA